jgi:hypothetical protein
MAKLKIKKLVDDGDNLYGLGVRCGLYKKSRNRKWYSVGKSAPDIVLRKARKCRKKMQKDKKKKTSR